MESIENKKKRAVKIASKLDELFPIVQCPLKYKSSIQLAIAVILSAQCTDERVNKVTPSLFKKFPDAKAFAKADLKEIEKEIFSTGFYKNKAKSIKGLCVALLKNHNGKLPQTMEELVKLPGIGRKTANVLLGVLWNIPGMVVDTHVKRLSNLLGLTKEKDPTKIEFDLMNLIPKKKWNDFGLQLIFHGRQTCIARRPRCSQCALEKLCPKKGIH